MKRTYCKNQGGFSLAEAIMAVAMLGIAATAVILPFSSGATIQAEGRNRTLAAKLASDLMEDIVDTSFDQIVSTYGAHTESQGQIVGPGGAVFTDLSYAKFSRSAVCEYVYVPQESQVVSPQFIRATVRVYYDSREITRISRLISE